MHSRIGIGLISLVAVLTCTAEPAVPTQLKAASDLANWVYATTPAADITTVCHPTAEGSIAVAGKPIGYIATRASFRNYRIHAEWRWPRQAAKNSNSGVLLHIASGPKDRAWPLCFQIQLKPTRAGDILPMAGAKFAERLSTAPGAKTPQLDREAESSEKPLGEWNECDITCREGAMEVKVNGVRQNRITHAVPSEGQVGFQLEGTPYELRNVTITPLDGQ